MQKNKISLTHVQGDDLFSILRNGQRTLSNQQSALCSYIISNNQQIIFYTIDELSQASGISPATIVRTMKALGFPSYKDFLNKIQLQFLNNNHSVWGNMQTFLKKEANVAQEPILSIIARDDIKGIQDTITPELLASFTQAIKLLDRACKIGVVGMRSSKIVAMFLNYRLNQLFYNVHLLAAYGYDTAYDELLNYNSKDVLIVFSLGAPHYVTYTHEIISCAKAMKIPIILITSDRGNPCIDNVSIPLYVANTKLHYSIIQPMILAEAIVDELARKRNNEARNKLQKLEPLLQQKKITF